jgi:hypothetical protein
MPARSLTKIKNSVRFKRFQSDFELFPPVELSALFDFDSVKRFLGIGCVPIGFIAAFRHGMDEGISPVKVYRTAHPFRERTRNP